MPSQPFQYQTPTQPYTGSIAQLMLAPGQIQAQALENIAATKARAGEQSGAIWGQVLQGVAQDVAQPFVQAASPAYQLQKLDLADAQRRQQGVQLYAQLAKQHPGDWNAIAQGLTEGGHPEQAAQVISNAAAIQEARTKAQADQLSVYKTKNDLYSQFAGNTAEAIKRGVSLDTALGQMFTALTDPNGVGMTSQEALSRMSPAMEQVHTWLTSNTAPKDAADQIASILKTSMSPEARTAEATAQSKEIAANLSQMQLDFMKGVSTGGDSNPLLAHLAQAIPPSGPTAQLYTQTAEGIKAAMALGPKGWDNAGTILQNALKEANTLATAGPEAAARAAGVPGSEPEWVQRYRDAAQQTLGRPLTTAELDRVTQSASQAYKEANTDPAVRDSLLAQKNMALALQRMQIEAEQPDISADVRTTMNGQKYLDLSLYKNATAQQYAKTQAAKQGIPAISGNEASGLQAADNARMNLRAMLAQVEDALPHDAGGRLLVGPENKLSKFLQTNDQLAAFNSWRSGAIQAVQALAEKGMGMRINQAEIDLMMHNDIPQITDTIGTARQRVQNMLTLLQNKENSVLVHDRSALPGGAHAQAPDLSGLAAGHARKFTSGPYAGQTWTIGPDGQPKQVP